MTVEAAVSGVGFVGSQGVGTGDLLPSDFLLPGTGLLPGTSDLADADVTQIASAAATGAGTTAALVRSTTFTSAAGAGSVTALIATSGSASVTGTGSVTALANAVSEGLSSVLGVGSVTALARTSGSASVTGVGSITALANGASGGSSSVLGVGSVTALIRTLGSASLTGTGSVTALVRTSGSASATGSASVTGAGSVAALITATATVQGTGTTSSVGRTSSFASATGAGSVATLTTQRVNASVLGAGASTALVTSSAKASILGAGIAGETGDVGIRSGSASVTGAGSVAVPRVINRATVSIQGDGSVRTAPPGGTFTFGLTSLLMGVGSVTARVENISSATSVGSVTALVTTRPPLVADHGFGSVSALAGGSFTVAHSAVMGTGSVTALVGEVPGGITTAGFTFVRGTGAVTAVTGGSLGLSSAFGVGSIAVGVQFRSPQVLVRGVGSRTALATRGMALSVQGAGAVTAYAGLAKGTAAVTGAGTLAAAALVTGAAILTAADEDEDIYGDWEDVFGLDLLDDALIAVGVITTGVPAIGPPTRLVPTSLPNPPESHYPGVRIGSTYISGIGTVTVIGGVTGTSNYATVVGSGSTTANATASVTPVPGVLQDADHNNIWNLVGGAEFGPVFTVTVVITIDSTNPKLTLNNTTTSSVLNSNKTGTFTAGTTLTYASLGGNSWNNAFITDFLTGSLVVLSSANYGVIIPGSASVAGRGTTTAAGVVPHGILQDADHDNQWEVVGGFPFGPVYSIVAVPTAAVTNPSIVLFNTSTSASLQVFAPPGVYPAGGTIAWGDLGGGYWNRVTITDSSGSVAMTSVDYGIVVPLYTAAALAGAGAVTAQSRLAHAGSVNVAGLGAVTAKDSTYDELASSIIFGQVFDSDATLNLVAQVFE